MEKMRHPLLEKFTATMDAKNREKLMNKADRLSKKGAVKLNDKLDEYRFILRTKSLEDKISMMENFIDKLLEFYPLGNDDSKNSYVERVSKPVYQLDKNTGAVIAEFKSVRAAAKALGLDETSIRFCCHNAAGTKIRKGFKTTGGYKWKFKI